MGEATRRKDSGRVALLKLRTAEGGREGRSPHPLAGGLQLARKAVLHGVTEKVGRGKTTFRQGLADSPGTPLKATPGGRPKPVLGLFLLGLLLRESWSGSTGFAKKKTANSGVCC